MTVPSNTVFEDGVTQVTGDNLNTFLQVVDSLATARSFTGASIMAIMLLGYTSPGDGGQGLFYWNAASVAADDGGVTTIVPTSSAAGAWTRIAI